MESIQLGARVLIITRHSFQPSEGGAHVENDNFQGQTVACNGKFYPLTSIGCANLGYFFHSLLIEMPSYSQAIPEHLRLN